jgi:hypothetical protein
MRNRVTIEVSIRFRLMTASPVEHAGESMVHGLPLSFNPTFGQARPGEGRLGGCCLLMDFSSPLFTEKRAWSIFTFHGKQIFA